MSSNQDENPSGMELVEATGIPWPARIITFTGNFAYSAPDRQIQVKVQLSENYHPFRGGDPVAFSGCTLSSVAYR